MTSSRKSQWLVAVAASVVAFVLLAVGFWFTHEGLNEAVFLVVPFLTGLAIAFMTRGIRVAMVCSMSSLLLSLSVLLMTGLEGVLCVFMAFPVLFVGIGLGALVGVGLGRKFIHRYGQVGVVLVVLVGMGLLGWTHGKPSEPRSLTVSTSMRFHADPDSVWDAVVATGKLQGDDSVLRMLGLPVPLECTLDEDGRRTCSFDSGEMVQQVTEQRRGEVFRVAIVESLPLRDWITFESAEYRFVKGEGFVDVIRTDWITSTLRPRWYWHWFETQGVRFEHRYVMESMREKSAQAR